MDAARGPVCRQCGFCVIARPNPTPRGPQMPEGGVCEGKMCVFGSSGPVLALSLGKNEGLGEFRAQKWAFMSGFKGLCGWMLRGGPFPDNAGFAF